MSLLKLTEIDSSIAKTKIGKIIFLRCFNICFSFNVISLCWFNQERILKIIQIFLNGSGSDSGFLYRLESILQFFRVGQRTDGRGKNIQKIFQFSDIPHLVTFGNISKINLIEQILQCNCLIVCSLTKNNQRNTAIQHIFR